MNQWDSAAESIYATSGFAMRVLTPIVLLLVIATVSGCCHRRSANCIGIKSPTSPIHHCQKCSSCTPQTESPQTNHVVEPAAAPVVAPVAPLEISTAPPRPNPTFQNPVVSEIPGRFLNQTEAATEAQPLPAAAPEQPAIDAQIEQPSESTKLDDSSDAIGLSDLPTPLPLPPSTEAMPVRMELSEQETLTDEPEFDAPTAKSSNLNLFGSLPLPTSDSPIALEPAKSPNQTDAPNESPESLDFAAPADSKPLLSLNQIEEQPAEPAEVIEAVITAKPVADPLPTAKPELANDTNKTNLPLVLRATTYVSSARNARPPAPSNQQPANVKDNSLSNQITEATQLDPVYGLPLNDQVNFARLPKLASDASPRQPRFTTANQQPTDNVQKHRVQVGDNDQHIHVHIHRDLATSSQQACSCQQCKSNVGSGGVIVYTEADRRTSVAPATQPFLTPAEPEAAGKLDGGHLLQNRAANRAAYYLPPRQILRLKASTNFNQPTAEPSVASIQMRNTLIVDGTHLLVQPEKGAAAQNQRAKQEVEVDELRDALKRLATPKQLR